MKEIFDWMREHLEETAQDASPNTDKLVVLARVERLINEAEAKWEAECCEWKPIDDDFLEYRSNCDHISAVNSYWKFCPFCEKPIKISEVE